MTQQDKDLLLRDLSARLPYKPKIKILSLWNENKEVEEDIVDSIYCVMSDGYINTETVDSDISLDDIVLYLRPMSSMTEEEFKKLKEYSGLVYDQLDLASFQDGAYKCLDFYLSEVPSYVVILVFDWLNAHHFDYRGLIEKGLAIEAPQDLYNF